MSQTKKFLLIRLISIVSISFVLGLLCILINAYTLLDILFLIIGALLIIDGIFGLINGYKKSTFNLVTNAISVILGILLMFNFNVVINVLIAVWFILLPSYEIIKNKSDTKEEFKAQLPSILLGIAIIVFGIGGVMDFLLKIIGWGFIIFALIYLILGIISLRKHY